MPLQNSIVAIELVVCLLAQLCMSQCRASFIISLGSFLGSYLQLQCCQLSFQLLHLIIPQTSKHCFRICACTCCSPAATVTATTAAAAPIAAAVAGVCAPAFLCVVLLICCPSCPIIRTRASTV